VNASNRFRPRIESLEDRHAPSTLAISSPQSDVSPRTATDVSAASATAHSNNGQHNGHIDRCYCVYID